MKRLGLLVMLAIGCGETTTSSAPYLYATSVVDPVDPFVVHLDYEPSAGHVDAYTVEVRVAGGSFVDARAHAAGPSSADVDLAQVAPDGGALELRIRADPGGFESNIVRYDPGPSLSTVSVSPKPDPATSAFIVHFGNRSGVVSLQRRVTNGGGGGSGAATGPYVTIATGTGPDTVYADADLSAYVDGALYEYQAVSSTPGAIPSRSAKTDRTPLNAPSLLSYVPGNGGATIVVRNNSAFLASIDVALQSGSFFAREVGFADLVAPGATATIVDSSPIPLAHFSVVANSGLATGVLDVWAPLQPKTALLQPTVTTLQAGFSAARDPAGNFCVVEVLPLSSGLPQSVVFAASASGAPLSLSTQHSVKCLVDSAGHSHVLWYQPGSPGKVMHSENDGTAWRTEEVASPLSLLPHGPDGLQSDVAFDFGLDGTLFAAWYVDTKTIQLATWVSRQAWAIENVPASPEYGFLVVSGDEAGSPHLLTLEFFGNYHLFKGASGWITEAIAPRFQISGCTDAVMSVAGGVVSFVSNEENVQRHASLLRGNSSGWAITDLGIGVGRIARSADGHAFVALGTPNFAANVVIVRDGAVVLTSVPTGDGPIDAGFSADGKAWALVWTGAPRVTAAAPAAAIPAVIFDEQ